VKRPNTTLPPKHKRKNPRTQNSQIKASSFPSVLYY